MKMNRLGPFSENTTVAGDCLDIMAQMPNGGYKTILADPPWRFKYYGKRDPKEDRAATKHYSVMTLDDIKALPISKIAASDCALFLWVTFPFLEKGFEVIRAWGFTYKTVGFVWVKKNKTAESLFWGLGYWTRANAEICLLATRGKPKRKARNVHQVIVSHIRGHSRKPDEQYERIEALVDGPYIELFARHEWPGWHIWGDEIAREG